MLTIQTRTPFHISAKPEKQELVDEYRGKPLNALRTPAVVIDRAQFARNCAMMHENALQWGASFRAHVKSHKTVEGTRMQLISSVAQTSAIVVSTVMEACEVVRDGLVADGTVKDILYGLPIAVNKVADLSALWDEVAAFDTVIRILVDHPDQIKFLEAFERPRSNPRRWSVFIKIDSGLKRAGLTPGSDLLKTLLTTIFASPVISAHGFYTHAGHSYESTSRSAAANFLSQEVEAVNSAAALALSILTTMPNATPREPFVLAIGSTPTAHVANAETRARLTARLNGRLELHAGNYPLLDLQQLHTGLIDTSRVAQRVLATVISYYPGRGEGGADEAMCDAGAVAMSKDTGPHPGYGEVVGKAWRLGRISQEHGILTKTRTYGDAERDKLELGEMIQIVGQHACLIMAAYPWYYVVDSDLKGGGEVVTDVWVPWKGW
ncbi:putative serine dehydratase domain-containing protein [Amylocystis lapponica]|nr:putative serine dehydratase domain-containing protein [Amylocystis lapponica]